jgi:hypothetical protein
VSVNDEQQVGGEYKDFGGGKEEGEVAVNSFAPLDRRLFFRRR